MRKSVPTDSLVEVRDLLRDLYQESISNWTKTSVMDLEDWWAEPDALKLLGPSLAEPFVEAAPTIVVGPIASGFLLGPLVALALGVGFAPVHRDPNPAEEGGDWIRRNTPPDFREKTLRLGMRHRHLGRRDRVLAVDDIAETGGQLIAIQRIALDVEAEWVGASVLIDNGVSPQTRRTLNLVPLLHASSL